MQTEQKPKLDRTTFTLRVGKAAITALSAAAQQNGFNSRHDMMKQLCLWAISAKPEDFEALGLKQ